MSEAGSFRGAWAKIKRGQEHLKALENEVAGLIESDTYVARGELNADRSEYVLRCEVLGEPDLMRAGLIFGDGIQNFRNALDHALCELVRAGDGEVTTQHQFPIYTWDPRKKAGTKRRWDEKTRGVDARFMEIIEAVQPYNTSDDDPSRLPLAVLQDFSNADKHQVIVPVALGVGEDLTEKLRPIPHDLEVIGLARARHSFTMEDGAEILRFRVRPIGPDPHVEMQGHVPVEIAFGADLTTTEGIKLVCEFVMQTLKALEVRI